MTQGEVIDQFMKNSAQVDTEVALVENDDDLRKVIYQLLGESNDVYCIASTEAEKAAAVPQERLIADYMSASTTVEEVPAAIAETGSIVCWSKGGKSVQASLVPAHHIAILSRKNIFADLDDFFALFGDSPPTNITLITGPSRTADIELTLTIGVHGPERVDVVVY